MRILCAHHAQAVHRMRMGRSRQRTALYGRTFRATVIPQNDFARVGAAKDQVRVEAREAARQDWRLAVEDVLRRRFLEARVPHQTDTVGIVRRVLVVVVGGDEKLRELR